MRLVTLLILGFSLIPGLLKADREGGLLIRSYDRNQDERTSFAIPAASETFRPGAYFSLSFDLKLRTGADPFGYVCRVVFGGQTSVDVMLNNPPDHDPYIGLIHHRNLLAKLNPGAQPDELMHWQHIELGFTRNGQSLSVTANGQPVAEQIALEGDNSVRILFGANRAEGFATTDAAPLVIKRIAVGLSPDKVKYLWPLRNPAGDGMLRDSTGGMGASIENADWSLDRHIHWRKAGTVESTSKLFPVVSPRTGEIYLVGESALYLFNAGTEQISESRFSPPLPVRRLCDQFVTDPYTGRLLMYDFEQPADKVVSHFDFAKSAWSDIPLRQQSPTILHHSKFISPADSSLVQLFGYGLHTYQNRLWRIDERDSVSSIEITIPPRYLSAVGVVDSMVYIYGGLGNESGQQEYGIKVYNDLYRLDPGSYTVTKLWERNPGSDPELAASTLVPAQDGKSVRALFFMPGRYQSYLILKEMSLVTGACTLLADTIPYRFRDTESDADLIWYPDRQSYYAVTVSKKDNGVFIADIYTVEDPVPPILAHTAEYGGWRRGLWLLAAGALAAAAWFFLRRPGRRNKEAPIPYPDPLQPTSVRKKPGIYLLNGFQVLDREMNDITGEFTPIMRQLLSLIILYSKSGDKGISSLKLREYLWFDKSEESSRNNRNVQISKMRTVLEKAGHYEISMANSYLKLIPGEDSYCDYLTACEQITPQEGVDAGEFLTRVLKVASRGPLLPDMAFDWLDAPKAEYSDALIGVMASLRERLPREDYATMIALSEGILRFDSLDETSVREKCRALMALRRIGAAHTAFEHFTKEYRNLMGQEFGTGFEKFIR